MALSLDALAKDVTSAINGGEILAGCLVALLLAAFPNLSKKMPDSDIVAKAVLIAVLGGAIFYLNGRIEPFATSLAAAAAVALLKLPAARTWMRARLSSIPRPSGWPQFQLSTVVFSMGILVYLAALGAPSAWMKLETGWIAHWTSARLTLFTLPARDEHVGLERSARFHELKWPLFRFTRRRFVEAFSHPEDSVAILPDVIKGKDEFGTFREAFAEWAYDDEDLLETYRAYGLPRGGEHVYVLRTLYDEGADGIDYTFRLMRLDNPPVVQGGLRFESVITHPVRLQAGHDELRRVTLVAGTEVAKALAREGGFDEEVADGIRTRLVGLFTKHAKDDETKDRRPADWPGHAASNEECETTESCLDLWVDAYSAPIQGRRSRPIGETVLLQVAGLELLVKAATRTERVGLSELPPPPSGNGSGALAN